MENRRIGSIHNRGCESEITSGEINTPAQQEIILELRLAMKRAKLLPKLKEFRSLVYSSTVAGRSFTGTDPERARLMVRVKNAAELFVELLSSHSDEKRLLIRRMGLGELLERRTWLNLLIGDRRGEFDRPCIDVVYEKLCLLDELQIAEPVLPERENLCLARTGESDAINNRACAWSAYLCGLLTIAGIVLAHAAVVSDGLAKLHAMSLTYETIYRTALVLLIVTLCVTAFRLLTRITFPGREITSETNMPGNTGLFEYRVSLLRAFAGCVGPLLLGFGTGISASAGFGAFGLTVMLDGIYNTYGIPFWLSQLLMSVACYGLAWKWARVPLGLGTVPSLLLIGPAISLGATIAPVDLAFIGNLYAFIAGTLIFSFGIAMTAAAALGPDGVTALSLAAEKKDRWPIPESTFFFNISAIGIGIALAGNFGVSSILNLIAVPMLLHHQIPAIRRWLYQDNFTSL